MRLLLAILLLLATPCFASPESIEGFAFGTSADEVVQRIGEPNDVNGPEYIKAERVWVWSWDYSRYGAIFEVQAKAQDGNKLVRSLTIVAPCPWKLANGVGIGDWSSSIPAAYPRIKKSSDAMWFVLGPKKTVTGFEINKDRIKSIFIGSK